MVVVLVLDAFEHRAAWDLLVEVAVRVDAWATCHLAFQEVVVAVTSYQTAEEVPCVHQAACYLESFDQVVLVVVADVVEAAAVDRVESYHPDAYQAVVVAAVSRVYQVVHTSCYLAAFVAA